MTVNRYTYRCHGLTLSSELALPELRPLDPGVGIAADVTLTRADALTTRWLSTGAAQPPPVIGVTKQGAVFLSIPDIADFWIEGGSHILIEERSCADPGIIRLYVIGLVLAIALYQRERLVMHTSAVARGNSAILFLGESGAGKSTSAAQLAARGYDVLTDDMAGIEFSSDERPSIWPASISIKLWSDTLDTFGIDRSDLGAVANKMDKYFVRSAMLAADRSYAVSAIVALILGENDDPPVLEKLDSLAALDCLYANTYRPEIIPDLAIGPRLFRQCAQVARYAPVFKLTRCRDAKTQTDLTPFLETVLAAQE